jgi:hypothetical protein
MSKGETYEIAKARILAELKTFLWEVHTHGAQDKLKFPWAQDSKKNRLDFKAQAVYLNGHSLFIDIRNVSCTRFVTYVNETIDARDSGVFGVAAKVSE